MTLAVTIEETRLSFNFERERPPAAAEMDTAMRAALAKGYNVVQLAHGEGNADYSRVRFDRKIAEWHVLRDNPSSGISTEDLSLACRKAGYERHDERSTRADRDALTARRQAREAEMGR